MNLANTYELGHVLVRPSMRTKGMSSGVKSSDLIHMVVDAIPVYSQTVSRFLAARLGKIDTHYCR